MNINLTLLVQAGNFFLAYVCISRFLLKPAYTALKAERAQETVLRQQILHEQQQLSIKQAQQRMVWQECHYYFMQHKPELERQVAVPQAYREHISAGPELDHEERMRIASQLVTALKPKVFHG